MKARIKNSPFVYDVVPWFENGLFCGYIQNDGGLEIHFKPDDLEFIEEAKPEEYPRNVKIYNLGLSVRTLNVLKVAFDGNSQEDGFPEIPIKELTLGDICQHTMRDFMKFRNFGRKSLNELGSLVETYNLEFKKL